MFYFYFAFRQLLLSISDAGYKTTLLKVCLETEWLFYRLYDHKRLQWSLVIRHSSKCNVSITVMKKFLTEGHMKAAGATIGSTNIHFFVYKETVSVESATTRIKIRVWLESRVTRQAGSGDLVVNT